MHNGNAEFGVGAGLVAAGGLVMAMSAPRFHYDFVCLDENGEVKWEDAFDNLVTTAGKNDLLDKYFKGSAYTATWYVGLIDADTSYTTGPAAGDTAASHGGWIESTAYSNANRPTLTLGTPASGSVNNSGNVAAFTINATDSIKGAFVITNNTKGGTTGTLYSAGTFAADRAVINGDTLNVTITLSV